MTGLKNTGIPSGDALLSGAMVVDGLSGVSAATGAGAGGFTLWIVALSPRNVSTAGLPLFASFSFVELLIAS
jgi:hypothetical protein